MKVLVTGVAGFIGSNLADRCIDYGWSVTGVDDLSNGHMSFVHDNVDFYSSDFSSPDVCDLITQKKFDVVFHLAAIPRVGYSVDHPIETNEVNVVKTLRLLQACRDRVGRVVFASSSSVYGGADVMPTSEEQPKNPRSPYALQKSIIEDYLKLYSELYGLDSTCLRFFNVFGPRGLGSSPYATALGAWLTAIKQGRPMRSDGDGTQSRDLCYVDNVSHACIKAALALKPLRARCYNVAGGKRTTNNEVLEYLMKRYPNAKKVDAPWRPGDVMHTHASIRRAQDELGYQPKVTAQRGIELTCDWYDENWDRVKDLKLKT